MTRANDSVVIQGLSDSFFSEDGLFVRMLVDWPGTHAGKSNTEQWAQELSTVSFVSGSFLRHDQPLAAVSVTHPSVGLVVLPRQRGCAYPVDAGTFTSFHYPTPGHPVCNVSREEYLQRMLSLSHARCAWRMHHKGLMPWNLYTDGLCCSLDDWGFQGLAWRVKRALTDEAVRTQDTCLLRESISHNEVDITYSISDIRAVTYEAPSDRAEDVVHRDCVQAKRLQAAINAFLEATSANYRVALVGLGLKFRDRDFLRRRNASHYRQRAVGERSLSLQGSPILAPAC